MTLRSTRPAALAAAALALLAAPAAAQVVRLPAEDRALPGQPAPLFAVGRAEGESWEMFAAVRGVGFDRAENLYVLDGGAHRILVFDRNGRYVRQIGKEGQGPGELSAPVSMSVAPDGRVAVLDLGRMGYSVFRADGTFERTVAVDGYRPVGPNGTALGLHPSNGIVALMAPPFEPGENGTFRQTHAPLVYVPVAGGAPRKFFDVPARSSTTVGGGANERQVMVRPPARFSPRASFGLLPDGTVALAFTGGYTVRVVDLDGTTLRYLQRPIAPRPVTEADRQAAREAQRRAEADGRNRVTVTMGGGGSQRVIQMGPGGGGGGGGAPRIPTPPPLEFADSVAVVQGLLTTGGGKVWVRRAGPSGAPDDGPIDLLDPAGRYLGTVRGVEMPRAVSAGGRAAWVEQDGDGVERVVVRQLPAGWR